MLSQGRGGGGAAGGIGERHAIVDLPDEPPQVVRLTAPAT